MSKDFKLSFLVDQSPEEAFNAINNVRGWWSEQLEGNSSKLGDEFTYTYKDMHASDQKLVQFVPNEKVVWLVTNSELTFTNKKDEWTGTKIFFEISEENNQTKVNFMHQGLTPKVECFDACSNGWTHYLTGSLLSLITTGQGSPDK